MKKLLIIIAACEVIFACSNKTSNSSSNNTKTQQNLEAVHNISKVFETGDTSLINKSVAVDFIDHKDYGDVKGIDSLKAFILASHEHIKNLKMELIKELADDEYVMSWMKFKGTRDGQAGTVQGDFDVRGMQITKFKNGKATEHWEAMDMRDVSKMMEQLTPKSGRCFA
jgi:predicted ester cyclase